MDLRNSCFITEECEFTNGILYSIFNLKEDGYEHCSYYAGEGETLEEIMDSCKQQLKYETIKHYPNPNLKLFKSNMMLSNSAFYKNTQSYELMQQLSAIEALDTLELKHIAGSNYKVFYYPRYLMYEITSMAVKLPKQVLHDTGEVEWSYEYLIYPNFTVNEDLLDELRNLTQKELPINIEKVPLNVEYRGFYRPFSTTLYTLLYMEYFRQCGLSKGITNAIRVMEHSRIAQDSLYDIYQNFRQNKKDYISYEGFDYYGPMEEMKLNDYIEAVGMSKADVGIVSQDAEKRMLFIKEHEGDVLYEPIIAYIENLNNSPFEAMEAYKEMESNRCYIRKMLYQVNMCWYDSFNATVDYLNMVQPACDLDPQMAILSERISWVQGGRAWGVKRHSHKIKRRKK